MKIRSNYHERPKITPSKGGGTSKTERAGYVSPKRLIEDMIAAGKRLNEYRREQFDTYDPNADIAVDPTRRPGMDLAEASAIRAATIARLPTKNLKRGDPPPVTPPAPQAPIPAKPETPK